jgi:hypothetical protein
VDRVNRMLFVDDGGDEHLHRWYQKISNCVARILQKLASRCKRHVLVCGA